MAVTPIKVNYNSIFANGTLTVSSAGTTWNDEGRIADGFINRLATTAGTPSGETIIHVDQGVAPATNLSADRIIIPETHNLDVVPELEFSIDDAAWISVTWAGPHIFVTGTLWDKRFDLVPGATGNRYWRLRFTKTDAALQIPEVWLTQQIELGVSETTEDGNAIVPMAFPLRPNLFIQRTLEGVRSAVERGATLRGLTVVGEEISATAFADWETFLTAISNGLNVFFIDDPLGVTWFAEVLSIDSRSIDSPERWTITLQIQEVP